MPIKLLQINVDANNGSNGAIARNIGDLVIKYGGESYIAYGRHAVSGISKQFRIGNAADVILHGIESRFFDNHGLSSRRVTRNLIRTIESIQPDIIHLHNIHGYFINYRILFEYLNQRRIPIVWTLHDCWSFTGHCAHFVSADCDKWKTGCFSCPLKKDYPKSFFIDASARNYQLKKKLFVANNNLTIVPVSEWLGELVRHSFLGNKNIQVIHNGIDLNVFSPKTITKQDLCLDKCRYTILGVANVWSDGKGLKEFIKLSQDNSLQIVLIGVDDNVKKSLPENIVAIKRTQNQQQLAEYYSVADLLVNPTYADTFPTINLEALACGTPVITYETGGSPEAIDEYTGHVVSQGDFDELYSSIHTYLNKTDEEKIDISKRCRMRAETFFNKDDCFAQYINLYRKLLKNG